MRATRRRPILRRTLFLAATLLLAGCRLDRSAIVWTTDVDPSFVCPGDSVRLSYNTAEGGCLGDGCPPEVEVLVTVAVTGGGDPALNSHPGLRMRGSSNGSVVGPIGALTTFTFNTWGGRYGEHREPQSHIVDVVLPERERSVPIEFGSTCSGDSVVFGEVDLSAPEFRSEGVRLVRVCNFSRDVAGLTLTFDGPPGVRTWALPPGDCTEDFDPAVGSTVQRAAVRPMGLMPRVECTTVSSGELPVVELIGVLTCDLRTASEPIVAASPGASPTPAIYEIATSTPTQAGQPTDRPLEEGRFQVDLNANTNCRRGPGVQYDVTTAFPQGQQVTVEGRNQDRTWWYALIPGSSAHCWIAGSGLTMPSPLPEVPLIAAPPTPTATSEPPQAPGKLAVTGTVCTSEGYSVTLGWTDVDGNDGYRVFRDGILIGTAGPNATGYTDEPPYGGPYAYGVEAYGPGGTSPRSTVVEAGCIY